MSEDARPNEASEPAPAAKNPLTRPRIMAPTIAVALYWWITLGARQFELPTFFLFLSSLVPALLITLAFVVRWLARRRGRGWVRHDGFGGFLLLVAAMAAFMHPSLNGMGLVMFPIPVALTIWAVWLIASRGFSWQAQERGWHLGFAALLTLMLCMRSDGLTGDLRPELQWRWTPNAEQRLIASGNTAQRPTEAVAVATTISVQPGDWTAFRGPNTDGVVHDPTFNVDWKTRPPKLRWKRAVGPAWSSMLAVGGNVYTQEQRGEEELVVCYSAATGAERWRRADPARHYDSQAGAGPRATPAFAGGRIFAFGATGVLNCLDAATGKSVWRREVAKEAGVAKPPEWGFSSSPLVVGENVVVFVGGPNKGGLRALKAATGEPAWATDGGGSSYASPQLAKVAGDVRLLLFGDGGLMGFDPKNGRPLWAPPFAAPGTPRSMQPHVVGDDSIVVLSDADLGVAMVDLKRAGDGLSAAKREGWNPRGLKSSFNDGVVLDGFLYGFDRNLLACIDLANGEVRWKGRKRFGYGQLLLLADQRMLLVLSESGDVSLVKATPEKFEESGGFHAIDGKTWNHPVVARGAIYVRNAEEMACYDSGAGTGSSGAESK